MAVPLIEQIAQAIQTACESVTTGNGYQFTVADVIRPTRLGGFVPKDRMVIIEQDDWYAADPSGAMKATGSTVRRVLPFGVNVLVTESDSDTTPIDSYINTVAADMEKAIVTDRTLGGLCKFLEVTDPETFRGAKGGVFEGFDGIRLNVEVTYAHLAGDPYTAA